METDTPTNDMKDNWILTLKPETLTQTIHLVMATL